MSDGKHDKEGGNRERWKKYFNITGQPQLVERGGRSTSNQKICAQQQPQPVERGGSSTSNQQICAQQQPQLTIGTKRTENPNEVTDTQQPPQHRQRLSVQDIGSSTSNQQIHAQQQPQPAERGQRGTSNQQIHVQRLPKHVVRRGSSTSNKQICAQQLPQLTIGTRTRKPNKVRYIKNIADKRDPEERRRLLFQGHENENCARQLLSKSIGSNAAHESHPQASRIFQQVPNQPTSLCASIQSNVRPLQYPPPHASQYLRPLQNPPLVFPTNFTSTSHPVHHANQHPNPGIVSKITSTSRQPAPHIFQGHQDEYRVQQVINLLPGRNSTSGSRDPSSHSSQGPQHICAYCGQGIPFPNIILTHNGRFCGHFCHLTCFDIPPERVLRPDFSCKKCRKIPPHLYGH